ncbi:hypothetical protein Btru_057882 [Bulinus truncatus]|nr:hypothetical protein Btru_057882 [Bulinus truncatus]
MLAESANGLTRRESKENGESVSCVLVPHFFFYTTMLFKLPIILLLLAVSVDCEDAELTLSDTIKRIEKLFKDLSSGMKAQELMTDVLSLLNMLDLTDTYTPQYLESVLSTQAKEGTVLDYATVLDNRFYFLKLMYQTLKASLERRNIEHGELIFSPLKVVVLDVGSSANMLLTKLGSNATVSYGGADADRAWCLGHTKDRTCVGEHKKK